MYPAALESKAQFTEEITEMREQIRKQISRLRELRIKKVEEPGMSIFPLLLPRLGLGPAI